MENYIIAGILILILGGAGLYVYKAKKRGVKCIGCPAGGNCSHKQERDSGCTCNDSCNGNCTGNCSCCEKKEK